MNSKVLFLCLTFFVTSTFTNNTASIQDQAEQLAEDTVNINLNNNQRSLLLNMLYNMYMYAQYETLFKKMTQETCDALLQIHNSYNVEEIATSMSELQKRFSKTQYVADKLTDHFYIWQALEDHISQHDKKLIELLTIIQEKGQVLVQASIAHNTDAINTLLQTKKLALQNNAQNCYNIGETFAALVTNPELFSDEKELENIQKINAMHNLNKRLETDIRSLSKTHSNISEYIRSLQSIAVNFISTVYEKQYDQATGPIKTLTIEIANDKVSFKESEQYLPSRLEQY